MAFCASLYGLHVVQVVECGVKRLAFGARLSDQISAQIATDLVPLDKLINTFLLLFHWTNMDEYNSYL